MRRSGLEPKVTSTYSTLYAILALNPCAISFTQSSSRELKVLKLSLFILKTLRQDCKHFILLIFFNS